MTDATSFEAERTPFPITRRDVRYLRDMARSSRSDAARFAMRSAEAWSRITHQDAVRYGELADTLETGLPAERRPDDTASLELTSEQIGLLSLARRRGAEADQPSPTRRAISSVIGAITPGRS